MFTEPWIRTVWAAGLLLAVGAGCGRGPGIARVTSDTVVVAFGDSLTRGTGALPTESYPAVLSEQLGCRVVNAGVPGEQTPAALRRLPGVLERERPGLVVLCVGGNDMLNGRGDDEIRAQVEAMIVMIRAAGADVVLVGVPRPGVFLKPPAFYRELAERHRLPYEDRALRRILRSPTLKSDTIHPNAAGYRRLADAVTTVIRKHARG